MTKIDVHNVLFLPYTTFVRPVYVIVVVTVNSVDIVKNICSIVEITKYCRIKFDIQDLFYESNKHRT